MRVLIAGGGTAGHINPGIAIAKYIKQKHPDSEILFVGTKKGLETKLVPREGFEIEFIKVKGFRRKVSLDTVVSVKELFQGALESRKVIKKFKPDIVIGTGGYVCGPVVFNASMMKIPTLIHEQNAFPGVTNRMLSRFADVVAISFKESEKYFKKAKKLVLTGNPVRSEMLDIDRQSARNNLGIKGNQPFVAVFGGSRGAQKINETVVQMLQNRYKSSDGDILFATGDAMYESICKELENKKLPSVKVVPYIFDMGNVMAGADLVVCRAGAITISELTLLGVPAVMIPSPNVTANHQEHNARSLEHQGAAVVILEKDLTWEVLHDHITQLLQDKGRLKEMSKNAKKLAMEDAIQKIYSIVEELL